MSNRGSPIVALALVALAVATPITARASIDDTFDYSGIVVTLTVPTTGVYAIVAAGAQGGDAADTFPNPNVGGRGAIISGYVSLTAGTVLDIVVGGQGGPESLHYGTGGGGGTFVFEQSALQPLIVAGGGGGGSGSITGGGGAGQSTENGQSGFGFEDVGSGGANGSSGGGGTAISYNGGGGGGWTSNGGDGGGLCSPLLPCTPFQTQSGYGGDGSPTFAGGAGTGFGTDGGFGGGGGGGLNGGGGGGGYSGGGGGSGIACTQTGCVGVGGGGGGSYIDPSVVDAALQSGANSGNGYVAITYVPEPTSVVLLITLLIGLGLAASRGRRERSVIRE